MAPYIQNKKAGFDYELLEKFEAGIELSGDEVKSIRKGQGSLEGAYAVIRGNEAYLVNCSIPPYQPNNVPKGYDMDRNRKLLLTKKEIREISALENQKGLTIVVLSMHNKGRKVKVSLASARGKKKFDKRESIKKRESERDVMRTLKNQ